MPNPLFFEFTIWCLGRKSNPHNDKRRGILSPLRLPVPPPRHYLYGTSILFPAIHVKNFIYSLWTFYQRYANFAEQRRIEGGSRCLTSIS